MFKITIFKQPLVFSESSSIRKSKQNNDDFIASFYSLNRSRTAIKDIVLCNDFDWFLTFTFNPAKIDSFDYGKCLKSITKWFNNVRSRKSPDMVYLIVPELHKSGRVHFHALVKNFNVYFSKSHRRTKAGNCIYNIPSFKLGFTTASPILNKDAVANYVSKYITKSLIKKYGHQRYLCSNNLIRPIKYTNKKIDLLPAQQFLNKSFENENLLCFTIDKGQFVLQYIIIQCRTITIG